jgi:hypothetical protein
MMGATDGCGIVVRNRKPIHGALQRRFDSSGLRAKTRTSRVNASDSDNLPVSW